MGTFLWHLAESNALLLTGVTITPRWPTSKVFAPSPTQIPVANWNPLLSLGIYCRSIAALQPASGQFQSIALCRWWTWGRLLSTNLSESDSWIILSAWVPLWFGHMDGFSLTNHNHTLYNWPGTPGPPTAWVSPGAYTLSQSSSSSSYLLSQNLV